MAAPNSTPGDLAHRAARPDALPARIVLFDGVCSFCDGVVRWLTRNDPAGGLHFAPLQGATAQRLREDFPGQIPDELSTFVYVERVGEQTEILRQSTALFRLCDYLGGAWRLLALLRVLPVALTDFAYRTFAGNRYRFFGKLDACAIPSPEDRARLLP